MGSGGRACLASGLFDGLEFQALVADADFEPFRLLFAGGLDLLPRPPVLDELPLPPGHVFLALGQFPAAAFVIGLLAVEAEFPVLLRQA